MKGFFFGSLIGLGLFFFFLNSRIDSIESFDENGKAIIVAKCKHKEDCLLEIGKKCAEKGFTINETSPIAESGFAIKMKATCKSK